MSNFLSKDVRWIMTNESKVRIDARTVIFLYFIRQQLIDSIDGVFEIIFNSLSDDESMRIDFHAEKRSTFLDSSDIGFFQVEPELEFSLQKDVYFFLNDL